MLARDFFDRDVIAVARDLIGAHFTVDGVGGVIVETEAYDHRDPASHSYNGRTARNAAMFGPPGHAYVYRSYGLHWCVNFVCGAPGIGNAVLIRALAPDSGLDRMVERRGIADPRRLCAGPGCLTEALAISRGHDGQPLDAPPFRLKAPAAMPELVIGERIGISKSRDKLWRFGAAGSPFLSRTFPTVADPAAAAATVTLQRKNSRR